MSASISQDWQRETATILEQVYAGGRTRLFEHEVYCILELLGLRVPAYLPVKDEREITADTLARFSTGRIVLKALAPGLVHKHRAGGVRVVYKDLEFVRWSCRKMLDELRQQGVEPQGVLLVSFVEYAKDLGNEILLGFRESEAFGPVISFSKGGTDAEHFAANFSPPNLILPPINREWAAALQESTHIQKKYREEGSLDYADRIVEAEVLFSRLAVAFSSFFPGPGKVVLKEFEINPFVFDLDRRFIALDGYASLAGRESPPELEVEPPESMRPFFEPRGVAVVGVSDDPLKSGSIIAANLVNLGREDLYCVNIRGGTAKVGDREVALYRSVERVPGPVDLAVITVPAEATVQVVESCARKGVRAIILITGGFGEIRRHQDLERRILAVCRKSGIRLMGPNCLGILYPGEEDGPGAAPFGQPSTAVTAGGINTFFIPEDKFRVSLERERNVAVLSQSGALGITEIYNLRSAISPRVIVSYGNQLDVDASDLMQYFEQDPAVDVMGLYIEGFRPGAGRRFFNTTARSTKPIIVYKAGRTSAGQRAARSHTASIAGEYEVARAAMKQAGLIVADSMIDHGDFIKTFALLHDFPVRGRRVAVIANAGYEKTYAADHLGDLELAELDGETMRRLAEIIPAYVSPDPLLDLTAMASDELFERCIDTMLMSDRVDALCVSIVPQAQVLHTTDREIEQNRENVAARIVHTVHRHRKPVVVSINVVSGADAVYNSFGQVMDSGGVPTFLTAERAMTCLNEFIRYKLIREKNVFSEWLTG